MTLAIEVAGYAKEFRALRKTVKAVQDISFQVQPGELVGFVGPNGAGKSTTIKALLGMIKATRGRLQIFGADAGTEAAQTRLGFMPEHPAFPDTLTGMEWMDYAHRLHTGERAPRERVAHLMQAVGLADAGRRLIRGYSKGMLQRLGLAQALVASPDLLILDEPLSGLDPLGRAAFKSLLREENQRGTTVFFTSHILEDVENLCSRIVLVHQGRVALDQDTHSMLHAAAGSVSVRFRLEGSLGNIAFADDIEQVGAGYFLARGLDAEQVRSLIELVHSEGGQILEVQQGRVSLEELFVRVVAEA